MNTRGWGLQVASGGKDILDSDPELGAFVRSIGQALLNSRPHKTVGFGTFSTCSRKASGDRPACKMAMFRPSVELRQFANGGPLPSVTGAHAEVVTSIIKAMQSEQGVEVPSLGRFAIVPVTGKQPKLIFHGSEKLNAALGPS